MKQYRLTIPGQRWPVKLQLLLILEECSFSVIKIVQVCMYVKLIVSVYIF